jgi:hypothetical protein
MGLGNGNPKEGDKGSNFNYELKTLQLLQAIAVAIEGGGGGGGLTCTTVEDCTIIESIKTSVQDFGTQLATIESACFSPNITVGSGVTVTNRFSQYQRVGNIVTCTVYFSIGATTAVDDTITIDTPIQEPASDYTSLGSIMGSLTSTGIENWRNLDFAGGTTNGISFFIRTTAPTTIQNAYVAQFSYAYNTSLC